MKIEVDRAHTVLLAVILFVAVGWIAPAAYASIAPQDHFITVHQFEAQNTTTNADMHSVCFDRTIEKERSGKIFTELYLVSNDSRRVEVDSRTMERYFQDGRSEVITPMKLPPHISEGKYRYVLVVQMDLTQGRVQREFVFTSETFTVSDDNNVSNTFGC